MIKYILLCSVVLLLLSGCKNRDKQLFSIIPSKDTGVSFRNTLKDTVGQNILDYLYYYNGGGVAIGDINNDGLPDIYFTSNQNQNKLYLNKRGLKFEDISLKANVGGTSDWNTGVAMSDVNGDGLLDIYVCAVSRINGFAGQNELFINNGNLTFTEQASDYGLDFDNYSSSATFFDYDLDGDLDLYLLNHAMHTEESFGNVGIRNKRTYESGDKLLRNDGAKFVDVSAAAGIYGGANGYGLGLAVSDFNRDGYPDIYVSNDFHEDDYYYLNNTDGTFTECLKEYFGHTSKFSMGNDAADLNNDGYTDVITLDMLPDDEKILKSSASDDNIQMQNMRTGKYGYHYQYARNMLQINQQADNFTEVALLSGTAATDWSWSPLIADYNQDAIQDIFIANGIPKRPNNLDYINYISNEQIKKKISTTNLIDQEALSYMPDAKLENNFFKGSTDLKFENITNTWTTQQKTYSTGSAYGDLDNDGDLDLVTNNINEQASIYINTTNRKKGYVKLKFEYHKPNRFGIGTKVFLYHKNTMQFKELFPQRGFQSSSQPIVHFGLDSLKSVDSIQVIWPNKTYQTLKNIAINTTIKVQVKENGKPFDYNAFNLKKDGVFTKISDNLGIHYKHVENDYIDSNRHKLIPYQISDRGPAMAIGDLNHDGKEDLFFANGKHFKSEIYLQNTAGFVKLEDTLLTKEARIEGTSAVILDIDGDQKNELLVGAGGGEFFGKSDALQNHVYTLTESGLTSLDFPDGFEDTSVIKSFDYDADGDQDVFIGNATIANDFGAIPESYVLTNNKGVFTKKSLGTLGMIRDAVWTDFNNDNQIDLIVVGEWMQPIFLQNEGGEFTDNTEVYVSSSLNGLWRSIISFDIDGDGDLDYLLGNWGTNTKLKATEEYPMRMYYSDFDNNSKSETIVAIEKNKEYYTLEGLDELSTELISLTKKKFLTYKDFAGKPIHQIFDASVLSNAKLFEVHTLASGVLKNIDGKFIFKPFNSQLQVAPINCFTKVNISGKEHVVCAGNYFGVKPYHGRFDGFVGALICDENTIKLGNSVGLDFFNKSVTKLQTITINDQQYLIALIHNSDVEIYKIDN